MEKKNNRIALRHYFLTRKKSNSIHCQFRIPIYFYTRRKVAVVYVLDSEYLLVICRTK